MPDAAKSVSSLIIALTLLLIILFLPDANLEPINKVLDFLTKGTNTAFAFGDYLANKVFTGVIVLLITGSFYYLAHRSKNDIN